MELFKPAEHDITLVNIPNGYAKRQVVCAANKFDDIVVLGVRHFCKTMNKMLDRIGINGSEPHEQGFVDQWGNFMSRKEALHILKTNGRFIRDDNYLDELYSENLY